MTQVKFMDDIVAEYNRLFADDKSAPLLTHYTANEMASNYYFATPDGKATDDQGNLFYVDQFTLQEWFDLDDEDGNNTGDNDYESQSLENKAHALYELAYVTCGGQL